MEEINGQKRSITFVERINIIHDVILNVLISVLAEKKRKLAEGLVHAGGILLGQQHLLVWKYQIMQLHVMILLHLFFISSIGRFLQISVKILGGKDLILKVNRCDTITSIKAKIHNQVGIPSNEQRLLFAGRLLDDSRTLADYHIHWNSALHLVPGSKGLMLITITTLSGNTTISLEVESSDTVGHLKATIQEEEGLPLDNHNLYFTGTQLQDSRTLADYNVQNNSTLHLVRRL